MKWMAVCGFVLFFSAFGMQQAPDLASSALLNALFVILIASVSFVSFVRVLGVKKFFVVVGVLSLFAYSIEYVGLVTGFPYGSFVYGELMGAKFFGVLPVLLPFAYVPLVLAAGSLGYVLVSSLLLRVVVSTALLVLFDLVIDPGSVALGFWSFSAGGWYYDVPLTNFLGWVVSGSIASALYFLLVDSKALFVRSALLMLCFYSGVAFVYSMWIAFVLSLVLIGLLVYMLYDKQ